MTPQQQHNFVDALVPAAVDAGTAERLRLFGQFVGSWDLVVTDLAADGSSTTDRGEWHFGWLLGGRAVGDVWIFPARSTGRDAQEHGLTVRFPDDAVGGWRSTWLGPGRRAVRPFIGRPEGDEIVLSGSFEPGVDTRWVFSDITATSFRWRNERRAARAEKWHLVQTFEARRA